MRAEQVRVAEYITPAYMYVCMYVCMYAALIETVKAQVENIELLEELIKAGAIVSYKTLKHGKSALDWARYCIKLCIVRSE